MPKHSSKLPEFNEERGEPESVHGRPQRRIG